LLRGRPEVVGIGLERRENRATGLLTPQAVLVGVQTEAVAVPRAQRSGIVGPNEVSADAKRRRRRSLATVSAPSARSSMRTGSTNWASR
jgi:hypothetical protein